MQFLTNRGTQLVMFGVDNSGRNWYTLSRTLGTRLIQFLDRWTQLVLSRVPDVPSTKPRCGFFWSGFLSSEGRPYYERSGRNSSIINHYTKLIYAPDSDLHDFRVLSSLKSLHVPKTPKKIIYTDNKSCTILAASLYPWRVLSLETTPGRYGSRGTTLRETFT